MEQSLGTIQYKEANPYNQTQNYKAAQKALEDYALELNKKGIIDDSQFGKALSFISKNASSLIRKDSRGVVVGIDPEAAYKIYAQDLNYGQSQYTADYNKWNNEQIKATQGADVKADDSIETALAKTGAGESVDKYDPTADKVNTSSTYAGYKPARNSASYPAYDDYEKWVKESGNENVSYEDWYKARGALDQANTYSALNPVSGTSQDSGENIGNTTEAISSGATAQAADLQQAIAQGAQAAQKEAQDSARAGAMAGINKQRAGMLGSQSSEQSQTSNTISGYAANQQQRGATQADYLQKMAQADALDQQASNMSKGALWNSASAAMGGAAGGAAVGATMGLSDERAKEPDDGIDDQKLIDAINQFKTLYKKARSK